MVKAADVFSSVNPRSFAKHEDPEVEVHEDSALGVSFVVGKPKLSGDECKRGVGLMTLSGLRVSRDGHTGRAH